MIECQSSKSPEGDVMLQCMMSDQHPHQASNCGLFAALPGGEKMLEPADATLGLFLYITPQDGVPVRVEGMDLCKNMVEQPLNLKEFADGRDASQWQDSFSNPPPPT